MNREVHVRFCEGVGVKFPRATRPLIHTFAPETSAQDVEKKKAELKTPHFLSLNQDIVASPQDEKCELKCVILTPREMVGEFTA